MVLIVVRLIFIFIQVVSIILVLLVAIRIMLDKESRGILIRLTVETFARIINPVKATFRLVVVNSSFFLDYGTASLIELRKTGFIPFQKVNNLNYSRRKHPVKPRWLPVSVQRNLLPSPKLLDAYQYPFSIYGILPCKITHRENDLRRARVVLGWP